VNFDVPGSRVEPQPSECVQTVDEGLPVRPVEDEVEMGHSDVVRPDVNLFHARWRPSRALELSHGLAGDPTELRRTPQIDGGCPRGLGGG
jgi:hypothetical protein